MVIVNAAGRIEIVNSQAEKMFGYPREEMIGKPVDMLVPEQQRHQHLAHRSAYLRAPQMRPMGQGIDLFAVRRDGTEFPVEIALSPIQIDEREVVCAAIRDQTEQKELEARVMAAERERGDSMRELAAFVQGAQEEERRRVSRELHDDLGQRLAALKLGMQLFEQELARTSEPHRARLQTLVSDVDRMIAEVRRLSYNLRPLALDDFGLTVALEMLCREFERVYKLQTKLTVSESLPAFRDPQVDIALYRIAQGALSNVARHASAHNASVNLSESDGRAVLVVQDDGRGFDLGSLRHRRDGRPGLGLIGMRERAEMLGGSFRIESEARKGTRVEAQIPVSSGSGAGPRM
jgi:PAS domain S-box-containing protein